MRTGEIMIEVSLISCSKALPLKLLILISNIFSDFIVERVERHGEDGKGNPDGLKQTLISFAGHKLTVLDGPPFHAFDFTPSMSLFVDFDSKEALETAFVRLSEDGKIMMPIDDCGFS